MGKTTKWAEGFMQDLQPRRGKERLVGEPLRYYKEDVGESGEFCLLVDCSPGIHGVTVCQNTGDGLRRRTVLTEETRPSGLLQRKSKQYDVARYWLITSDETAWFFEITEDQKTERQEVSFYRKNTDSGMEEYVKVGRRGVEKLKQTLAESNEESRAHGDRNFVEDMLEVSKGSKRINFDQTLGAVGKLIQSAKLGGNRESGARDALNQFNGRVVIFDEN